MRRGGVNTLLLEKTGRGLRAFIGRAVSGIRFKGSGEVRERLDGEFVFEKSSSVEGFLEKLGIASPVPDSIIELGVEKDLSRPRKSVYTVGVRLRSIPVSQLLAFLKEHPSVVGAVGIGDRGVKVFVEANDHGSAITAALEAINHAYRRLRGIF